jgi:hypothetical protein
MIWEASIVTVVVALAGTEAEANKGFTSDFGCQSSKKKPMVFPTGGSVTGVTGVGVTGPGTTGGVGSEVDGVVFLHEKIPTTRKDKRSFIKYLVALSI